jgi:hypothetical protein
MHIMRLAPYPASAGVFVATETNKVDYGAHGMLVSHVHCRIGCIL